MRLMNAWYRYIIETFFIVSFFYNYNFQLVYSIISVRLAVIMMNHENIFNKIN